MLSFEHGHSAPLQRTQCQPQVPVFSVSQEPDHGGVIQLQNRGLIKLTGPEFFTWAPRAMYGDPEGVYQKEGGISQGSPHK